MQRKRNRKVQNPNPMEGKMSKKERGKGEKGKIWELYEIKDGKVIRKNRICPKCGGGVFLAKHGDRLSCGKCGYTEKKK